MLRFNAGVGWHRVTIVGAGLLGGSLGLAIKRAGIADEVVALVRRKASVEECLDRGVADTATQEMADAVQGADLVILCTPISQMESVAGAMQGHLKPGAVVTDVGSAKEHVIAAVEAPIEKAGGHFVGSHPMAGSEKSGLGAAVADLFDGAICAVTPTSRTQDAALERILSFWRAVGARPTVLSPTFHDRLVSRTSHLPHMVAAVLTRYVLSQPEKKEHAKFCGTGFRDTTRLASGSPEMWRDIVAANRENLLTDLDGFIEMLQDFRDLISSPEDEPVCDYLETARKLRDDWQTEKQQGTSEG